MFRSLAAAALSLLALSAPTYAQTLEEMAGQMIVVGFRGNELSDKGVQGIVADMAAGRIGGVMYLQRNVKSLDAAQRINSALRSVAPQGLPPLIALDQEGGAVERLTKKVGFKEIPSARDVARTKSPAEARALYGEMAQGMANVGFTVNFGPVTDLDINPANEVITKHGRSYGSSPETVASYAGAFIDAHHAAGMITSLKHFPGHGSSTGDSHDGFVDITGTWRPAEIEPYRILIGNGYADIVMVGHLYHADYSGSGSKEPATLSSQWIDGVLRSELGFKGLVISDDLGMAAIRELHNRRESIILAVNAGTDLLLFLTTDKDTVAMAGEIQKILIAEAEADPAFRARIEASYARIKATKARIGG